MIRGSLFTALLVLAPSLATAQGLAGPFGGLFGRAPERIGKEYSALDLRSTVGGQYDAAILDDSSPAALVPASGSTAGANAGLTFERRSDRLRLEANGSVAHHQFSRKPAVSATSYDAGALLITEVATRLSLEASASYLRSPFYHLGLDAGVPDAAFVLPGGAFAARLLDNETSAGTVGFTSPYSKRSTLNASYSRSGTRFFDEPDNNYEMWGAQASWRHKLSRDVGAHVTFGREQVRQSGAAGRFVHETIDIGLDLTRGVSLARRTELTFYTQTSMVRETAGERHYRLNGGIALTRGFRRTWVATLAAHRDTDFLPGFLQPVFSDGVNASVSGLLAKRIEWSGAIGASRGQVGFDDPGKFLNYNGMTRLAAGVTRHLGVYAQYAYYRYDVPFGSTAVFLLPHQSRQSVSVGFSAYVPIFNKVRAPRDPG